MGDLAPSSLSLPALPDETLAKFDLRFNIFFIS